MLTAVVTQSSAGFLDVRLVAQGEEDHAAEGETHEELDEGPNPIVPELKELAWGAGAFVVFALLMRFVLFPRLKKGMDARYAGIRSDHEEAERITASARGEVEAYERELATVRAEAASRIDAARGTLEGERTARLAQVNAQIAERRAQAAAQAEATRNAVHDQVAAAVGDVSARAAEIVLGRAPSDQVVRDAVAEAMGAGVAR